MQEKIFNMDYRERFFISTGHRAVLGQYEFFTDQNTRDHIASTIGNGDSMYGLCVPKKIPRRWEQQE